ncbi:MAG: sulfatase-like hydrolase/transferase [Opitutaceae bacterium]|nr:sulfatase-like hydrolase/transferase [Opitutaceae bacterium]
MITGARLVLILTLFALPRLAAGAAGSRPPNILFIMVDEMRWNVMSCAGHPLVKTPNLDRIAREGTRFATAYTVAPICGPSRYSFFTSRYAHVHGAIDNSEDATPLPGQVVLPAILKKEGYETAISGKLHFSPRGPAYGFDYFWSDRNEGPGKLPRWPEHVRAKYGKDVNAMKMPGSSPFPDDPLGKDLATIEVQPEDTQVFWTTARAEEYLDKRDRSRPFFLYVSYLEPHSPSLLVEMYRRMFDPAKVPIPPLPEKTSTGTKRTADNRHEVADPAIVRAMTAAYFAKVQMVDDNVGRLLARLKKDGLDENTIIIFSADHGNMLGDHGRWFKGVMHEGSSRIPLLMKVPASHPAAATFNRGKVVNEIVENIDVMPTLMNLIGRPLPRDPGFQGMDLAPLVAGNTAGWKNRAFAERGSCMIRTPEFKLIQTRGRGSEAPYELYDMQRDPREDMNLAGDPKYAKIQAELNRQLEAWLAQTAPLPIMPGVQTKWDDSPAAAADAPVKKRPREKRAPREKAAKHD